MRRAITSFVASSNAPRAPAIICLLAPPCDRTALPHPIAGDWAELEFDSRPNATSKDGEGGRATIHLTHLKSYQGMGTADVKCVSGCKCPAEVLDGTWDMQASLMQNLVFKVGPPCPQGLRCRAAHAPDF